MDPTRWVDDATALTPDERRALDAGLGVAAPAAAKRAVWHALVSKLPHATAASAAVGTGLTAASLAKPLALGLALGAATAIGIAGIQHAAAPTTHPGKATVIAVPSATPPAEVPRAIVAPGGTEQPPQTSPTPRAPPPIAASPTARTTTPAPAPSGHSEASFPSDEPAATNATLLESRAMAGARALLRGGKPSAALEALAHVERDFPSGVLSQERDALRIEALLALGERERARALAAAFLARHPASPHAAAVRRAFE